MTAPNPERRILADFIEANGDAIKLVFAHGEMFLAWTIAGATTQPGGVIPISPEALDHFATKVWCPRYRAACQAPDVLPEGVVRLRR